MRSYWITLAGAIVFLAPAVFAQTSAKPANSELRLTNEVRSSGAFAELVLRKTELQAELEALLVEYTEDFPKIVDARYLIELLEKEKRRLTLVKATETGKLTAALGRLMVKKADMELELWMFSKTLQDAHPDVKRAKRKVEIYESAIREILGQ